MANIAITKTGNSLIIDFGDYSSSDSVDSSYSSYDTRDIVEVDLLKDNSHVLVMMRDSHQVNQWNITFDSSYSGSDYFIVDSVEGVAPSTQKDLFDKITALRG